MNNFWDGLLFSGIPPLVLGVAVSVLTNPKSGLFFGINMFVCFAYIIFGPSASDKYDN